MTHLELLLDPTVGVVVADIPSDLPLPEFNRRLEAVLSALAVSGAQSYALLRAAAKCSSNLRLWVWLACDFIDGVPVGHAARSALAAARKWCSGHTLSVEELNMGAQVDASLQHMDVATYNMKRREVAAKWAAYEGDATHLDNLADEAAETLALAEEAAVAATYVTHATYASICVFKAMCADSHERAAEAVSTVYYATTSPVELASLATAIVATCLDYAVRGDSIFEEPP